MKGFGDENYWMKRAQRAEAENALLLTRINEVANDFVPFPGQEGLALDEMREELTALASAPADGYKLVPVEPTIEMTVAGGQEDAVADVYRAMIAAAPTDGRE